MTQQEAITQALRARGFSEDTQAKTRKFVVMIAPGEPEVRYYVGRAGALRRGKTIAGSVPAADKFKYVLLREGGYY